MPPPSARAWRPIGINLMKNNYNICDNLAKIVSDSFEGSSRAIGQGPISNRAQSNGEYSRMPWTIFNREGRRKYLTSNEIDRFVQSARAQSTDIYIFCCMMAFTGCRISEALSLTRESVDFEAKAVIVKSLKKRGKMIYRAIPLPPKFLTTLARWLKSDVSDDDRLWPWSRMTGYRRICEVMRDAGVKGGHAMPKGLRHGFGVRAIQASVPLNLVQKWLGHADIKTTAIYTSAMGPEERAIASRMWGRNQAHGGIIEDTCSPPERVPPSACDTIDGDASWQAR